MKPWTEDNFLERLAPQLRPGNGSRVDCCPDSQLLASFVDGQLDGFARNAVAGHIERCADCRELHERLVNFASASVPAQSTEWVNAEKRLDNWMEGFLRAQHGGDQRYEENSTLSWRARPKRASAGWFWNWRWAAAAAALFVLAGAAVVVMRRESARPTPVQVVAGLDQQTALPPLPPAAISQDSAQTNNSPSQASGAAKQAPNRLRVTPSQSSQKKAVAPEDASLTQPSKSASVKGRQTAAPESAHKAGNESSADIANQSAQTHSPPVSSPNDRIMAGARSPSASPREAAMAPANMAPQAPPAAPSIAGESKPTKEHVEHRAPLRLEAGTRVWIKLGSVNRQPDGSFTFRGSLLQPVAYAGKVRLDQNVQVMGLGSVNHGQVTVQVTEFVADGASYILQGATNAHVGQSGTGRAVEFDDGRVLEMWLASASVYEN